MSDLFKIKQDAINKIESSISQLNTVGLNLYSVGLDRASKDVIALAYTIDVEINKLMNAIDEDQQKQFERAQQSSLNVLNAAMAGIKIGERGNDDSN